MPIDLSSIEKLFLEIRNLESASERIKSEARREFEKRGGADDVMYLEEDLTRRLYVLLNAAYFLHAGLVDARDGSGCADSLVPGAEGETRDLWLQHLRESGLEGTLHALIPKLLKLVLRAPTWDVPYPLLPIKCTDLPESSETQEPL